MAQKKNRKFEVVLAGRKDVPERTVGVIAPYMTVNHRGDLLFCESRSGYGDPPIVACYRTGSWVSANLAEPTEME